MSSKRNSYSYSYCVFCRVCVCIITINVYLGNCPCTFIRIQDALYLSPSLSLCTLTNIYCCVFWLVLTCKPVHLSCLLPPILMTTTGYLYPLPNTLNTFVLSFLYAILHHHTYICIWEYVPFAECSTGHCNIQQQQQQQLTQCCLLRRTSPGRTTQEPKNKG